METILERSRTIYTSIVHCIFAVSIVSLRPFCGPNNELGEMARSSWEFDGSKRDTEIVIKSQKWKHDSQNFSMLTQLCEEHNVATCLEWILDWKRQSVSQTVPRAWFLRWAASKLCKFQDKLWGRGSSLCWSTGAVFRGFIVILMHSNANCYGHEIVDFGLLNSTANFSDGRT